MVRSSEDLRSEREVFRGLSATSGTVPARSVQLCCESLSSREVSGGDKVIADETPMPSTRPFVPAGRHDPVVEATGLIGAECRIFSIRRDGFAESYQLVALRDIGPTIRHS